MAEPPVGECHLHHEHGHAHKETIGVAAHRVQCHPVAIIQETAYYRLGDIIGEAHAPVWGKNIQYLAVETPKQQQECAGHGKHEGEVVPRIEGGFDRCEHERVIDLREHELLGIVHYHGHRQRDAHSARPKTARTRKRVIVGRREQPFAPQQQAQHEQGTRLEHAAIAPSPVKAGQLAGDKVHFHHLPKVVAAELRIHIGKRENHLLRIGRRVDGGIRHLDPFKRLQHKYHEGHEQGSVANVPHRHKHEPQDGIKHKYLTGEKRGVDKAERQQQHKPPHIPILEILAAAALAAALQVECEPEEQGEDGVSLARKREEQKIPYCAVKCVQRTRGLGERVKIKMLDVV